MPYRNKVLWLIIVTSIFRFLFTCVFELGADEAYYWTYARNLQWNYFDHPPLIALLIRLTTLNLSFQSEIFVRLGAVISSGVCTWLMFKIGTLIKDAKTGWYAAILFTVSIYGSITLGTNIIPDSPQMVFWLLSLLVLFKISKTAAASSNLLWCLFGITAGLCIMSKVHGVFLWFGVIIYALAINRDLLKYRGIYLAAGLTLLIISPIIIWNIQNDFITYRFHSSRVAVITPGINLPGFGKAVFQQISINNPVNFFFIITAVVWAFKANNAKYRNELYLMLMVSLPLIVIILLISLFRETFAHWSAPAYTTLLFLPAIRLADYDDSRSRKAHRMISIGIAYMVLVALLQVIFINYTPGTISKEKARPKTGADDITLTAYGWEKAAHGFDSLYKTDVAHSIMPAGSPIIVTNWFPACSIEYYIARHTGQQLFGIGDIFDLHQYYWVNKMQPQLKDGDDAYFIVPSSTFAFRTSKEVYKHFQSNELPLVIPINRSGVVCEYISVFRLRGYHKAAVSF